MKHFLSSIYLILVSGLHVLSVANVNKETPDLSGGPTFEQPVRQKCVVGTVMTHRAPCVPWNKRVVEAFPRVGCPGEVGALWPRRPLAGRVGVGRPSRAGG